MTWHFARVYESLVWEKKKKEKEMLNKLSHFAKLEWGNGGLKNLSYEERAYNWMKMHTDGR